jgi:hypothetical protein
MPTYAAPAAAAVVVAAAARSPTEGFPPNVIAVNARVAPQTATPLQAPVPLPPSSPVSPQIAERIRVNREAALRRRMDSSPGPEPVLATPSPVTPQQRSATLEAAKKLETTIGTRLPCVSFPNDRCRRCAGAMHAGACSDLPVNQVLYNAGCCACCALPVRCVLVIALFVCCVFV